MVRAFIKVGAFGMGCLLAGAAMASQPAASAATAGGSAASASDQDKSRKVCRTIRITGTRLTERHCRTKADWQRDEQASQRYLEEGLQNYRRDGEFNSGGPR